MALAEKNHSERSCVQVKVKQISSVQWIFKKGIPHRPQIIWLMNSFARQVQEHYPR